MSKNKIIKKKNQTRRFTNGINPSIFKEYDIRGKYPNEINEEAVYHIATAFCEYLARMRHFGDIILGYDARLSSPMLAKAFAEGVQDQGRDVVDIGLVTTPLFYFVINTSEAAGGAMITASHNPQEFNGIKLARAEGRVIYRKEGLPVIQELISQGLERKINSGTLRKEDYTNSYLDFLMGRLNIKRSIRIVADASNGSGGPLLKELFKRLNVEIVELFFEPDGRFPNHSPNPLLRDSQKFTKEKVKEINADFGFILDADGDRIIFIDEQGEIASANLVNAFLLDQLLKPGDLALITVLASKNVIDVIQKKDAHVEKVPVGHANIKAAMREKNARFASELSGHYYFRDFFFADSALLMLMHMITLFSRENRKFSEIINSYQKYFHSDELNFDVKDREAIMDHFKKEYSDGKQSFIDGLTVEYPSTELGASWWFNIRPSKTEPLIRLVIEADTQELMEEKIKELSSKIK